MVVADFPYSIFYWSGIALCGGDWVLLNSQARDYIGVENKNSVWCIKDRTVCTCASLNMS